MFNLFDKDFTNKSKLVKSMYKIFKLEGDEEREYTVCESSIGELLE